MSEFISIKAHFDGKTIVPDEPVNLQANESIVIDIHRNLVGDKKPSERTPEERRAALIRLMDAMKNNPVLPIEALSRESIYDDRY